MTATDELRRLLDEHGVKYRDYFHANKTWWSGRENVGWYAENRPSANGLYVMIEAVLTPEQAIAATLDDADLAAENAKLRELLSEVYEDQCDESDRWKYCDRMRELGIEGGLYG